jgi:CRISPR-associated endoribonuclease Cas6
MRFLVKLISEKPEVIPINYQYPLSAAIYRIIAKGDADYANFLHEKGYGKKFKFFSFSQITCPFKIEADRLLLQSNELSFQITFHLPKAAESFIKGLFQSEKLDIADRISKGRFTVQSIKTLPSPLESYKENEITQVVLRPLSPVVAGLMKDNGKYDFLPPDDPRFAESLIYNWRSKIETCYDKATAQGALLIMEQKARKLPPRSRLITVKAGTEAETKIRGWMNVDLSVTAEKRFIEILLNAGVGVYNAQGMGYVEGNN